MAVLDREFDALKLIDPSLPRVTEKLTGAELKFVDRRKFSVGCPVEVRTNQAYINRNTPGNRKRSINPGR
jgi:hypothetical protein